MVSYSKFKKACKKMSLLFPLVVSKLTLDFAKMRQMIQSGVSENIFLFPVPQEWDANKRRSSKTFKICHKVQTATWVHTGRGSVLLF